MPTYRLYCLDGAGKIDSAEWIEAVADADALRQARERVDGHRFELWEGKRLISCPTMGGGEPQPPLA